MKNKLQLGFFFLFGVLTLLGWFLEQQFFLPVFAVLVVGIFVSLVDYCFRKYEKVKIDGSFPKDEAERKSERVKFLFQSIILPVFAGFLLYLVTDRIYGTKEKIIIGISNFSYSDTIDFASVYKRMYIDKANEMLGGYRSSIEFDMVTISGDYRNLWEALEKGRIDLALVSPYNFKKYYQENTPKFSNTGHYKILGQKFTEIGTEYTSGFLMNKEFRYMDRAHKIATNIDSLKTLIKNNRIKKIYLSQNTLSTSSRVVPEYWLSLIGNLYQEKNSPIIRTGSTVENFIDVSEDTRFSSSMCSFSNDMWNNVKKFNPEIAKNLCFVKINEKIPMDVLIAKKSYVDSLNKPWNLIVDLAKLRSTDISEKRSDKIFRSLRYFIDMKDEKMIIDSFLNSSIWKMQDTIFPIPKSYPNPLKHQ